LDWIGRILGRTAEEGRNEIRGRWDDGKNINASESKEKKTNKERNKEEEEEGKKKKERSLRTHGRTFGHQDFWKFLEFAFWIWIWTSFWTWTD